MANIAYYIKRKISSMYKAAVMSVSNYRYIAQQNISTTNLIDSSVTIYDHNGNPVDDPLQGLTCLGYDRPKLNDMEFTALDLNTQYTCHYDELFVGGMFHFCSSEICKAPMIFSTSQPSILDDRWTGLLYRKHNDNNNYLVYYTQQAFNVVNSFNFNSNTNLMYAHCSPFNCNNCKFTSVINYVKYINANELYATAPNGYLYNIKKDNNGYFYVNTIHRTPNYQNISDNRILNKCTDSSQRYYLPAFAIDSVGGVTIYSISNYLMLVVNNTTVIPIEYVQSSQCSSSLSLSDKYIPFITDLCMIKNGHYNDVLATTLLLTIEGSNYNPVGYIVNGVAVMLYKQINNTQYCRDVIYVGWADQNTSVINAITLSHELYLYKNFIRIQKIDTTNFYVTIAYDLLTNHQFAREDSLLSIEYNYNTRTASVVKNLCSNSSSIGVSAVCWADSGSEILVAENGAMYTPNNKDLNYYLLDGSNNCISETLNAVVPNQYSNTSELVVNDMVGASVNTSLYKLVKCDDPSVVIYPNALSNVTEDLVGHVVNIYGHYKCCFIVQKSDECQTDEIDTEYVLVTNVYDGCRECLGIELNNIKYDLKYIAYKPSITIGTCDIEEYIFTKCKFAEAVYKKYLEEAYKIKPCCNNEYDKWWIKATLIDMLAKETDICENKKDCKSLCVIEASVVSVTNIIEYTIEEPGE